MKTLEFAPAARAELDAAADRYEAERPGRGVRFYAAVERTAKLLVAFAAVGPEFPGVRPALGVRRRIVRGFPFVVAYRVVGETIRVDAVAHMHRRPGYWHRRAR
ncbi:MAG: type II toxin-antitoxin system RelE/ParE family toxin [Deltaproteobacteria bacterium]|nr:type II toxin-antitoxin system RelE/ParE family toxin [Deltaproteobacteria bacterium]